MAKLRGMRAPVVARVNMDRATGNIRTKLSILKAWSREGVPEIERENGERSLDFYPKSLRQFNAWDGSQNNQDIQRVLPDISRNANDTLRKHADLRKEVEAILEVIHFKAVEQATDKHVTKLVALKRSLKTEQQLRHAVEQELIMLRRSLKKEQDAHQVSKQKLDGQLTELKRRVDALLEERNRLAAANADLVATAAKVSPLRKAGKR